MLNCVVNVYEDTNRNTPCHAIDGHNGQVAHLANQDALCKTVYILRVNSNHYCALLLQLDATTLQRNLESIVQWYRALYTSHADESLFLKNRATAREDVTVHQSKETEQKNTLSKNVQDILETKERRKRRNAREKKDGKDKNATTNPNNFKNTQKEAERIKNAAKT